jgi:hypothetical protein
MPNERHQTRQGTSRSQFCKGDDRADYIETSRQDGLQKETHYIDYNKAHRGNSLSRLDRSIPIVTQPQKPPIHDIVNLCQSYIETVFYQYDAFPHTNNEMIWHNDKIGRIINFTYYLDSSMGDSVTIYIEKISINGHVENLLNTPMNGNNYIKGTFNTQELEFKCNMIIKNDDMVKVRFENASAADCTIMAKMDIKYGEEDFYTK